MSDPSTTASTASAAAVDLAQLQKEVDEQALTVKRLKNDQGMLAVL